MEIKQQLRLSQQLVMTPQLQQAIKLLQMSRMELTELVQEELLENPVLEDGLEGRDAREISAGVQGEATTIDQQVEKDDRAVVDESKQQKEEIDWERYLENHAMQAPLPAAVRRSGEGGNSCSTRPARRPTRAVPSRSRALPTRCGKLSCAMRSTGYTPP